MIWFTRLYRRFYLWTHRKRREQEERLHAIKMLLKVVKDVDRVVKNLDYVLHQDVSVVERKVLIEKYTVRDRARDKEIADRHAAYQETLERNKRARENYPYL